MYLRECSSRGAGQDAQHDTFGIGCFGRLGQARVGCLLRFFGFPILDCIFDRCHLRVGVLGGENGLAKVLLSPKGRSELLEGRSSTWLNVGGKVQLIGAEE